MPIVLFAVQVTAEIPQEIDPQPSEDVIEIVGQRDGPQVKIDRRSYRVKDTPSAIQKDAIQLLRGLPAVTVSPDDQISLLGTPGVTIQVDGREYRGELKNLHGSDIERIEIITNPSAQYSAQGTGGIINLISRKVRDDGTSGLASGEISSSGLFSGRATIKAKRGKTTVEVSPDINLGTFRRSHTLRELTTFFDDDTIVASRETEQQIAGGQNAGIGIKITRELHSQITASGEVYAGYGRFERRGRAEVLGLTPGFQSYDERNRERNLNGFYYGNLAIEKKGKREGEKLSASVSLFGNPDSHNRRNVTLDDGSGFTTDQRDSSVFWRSKVDWERQLGQSKILSIGGSWDEDRSNPRYRYNAFGGAQPALIVEDEYRGWQRTLAGYATLQFTIKRFELMPGVRLESTTREVTSAGHGDVRVRETSFYPTAHFKRAIGKYVTMTASYSRRISRPGLDQLRPFLVQNDPRLIALGNPRLRDETTHAFEVNVSYRRKSLSAGLTLYDRTTKDLIRTAYSVDEEGRSVTQPFNVGTRSASGAQIDISLPLIARIKGTWSVNLFQSREPSGFDASDRRSLLRYSSDLTFDYQAKDRDGIPGDVAQIQWSHHSAENEFQLRREPWDSISASYTRSFSRKLSLTATASSGLFNYRTRIDAPTQIEIYKRQISPSIRFKLQRTFGDK